jgi:type VI secretion system secreted protein Hcp
MQKILFFMLALSLPAAGSLYAQANIGNIDIEGSRLKIKTPIVGFQTSIQGNVDERTGMATGRRQHTPITITRVVDGSSPLLQQAAATGEVLKEVTIQLDKPSAHRNSYLQIKLTNVLVSGISLIGGIGNGSGPGSYGDPVEQISLVYANIQYVYSDGKDAFKDNWTDAK